MFRKLYFYLLCLCCLQLSAQQLPQLNNYMFNQFLYNPGAGGTMDNDLNVSIATRFQWLGLSGAPITNYSWADLRFMKNSMSAGAFINYESIGANSYTEFGGNYSYILRINSKVKLGMGLRVGLTSYTYDASKVAKVWDTGDQLNSNLQFVYPKFGTGFHLYGRRYYVSLGLPDLFSINQNKSAPDLNKSIFEKNRNFTLMGGYKFKITDGFRLYPNLKLYYYNNMVNNINLPFRADISLLAEITDYFWVGPNFNTQYGGLALMAGFYVSSAIKFMYGYEFMIASSKSSAQPFGAHELNLFIRMDDFFTKKNK